MDGVMDSGAPGASEKRSRGASFRTVALILVVLVVVLARPAVHHARATSLLLTFSNPDAKSVAVEESAAIDVPIAGSPAMRSVPVRFYFPANEPNAPAVVLVHGVHRLGIEEPRLQRFARSLSGAGITVMTPRVDELADYQVAPASIDTVGAAVRALASRTGHAKVGLMGTSFGGGVALLTAADARFASNVSFVVAIGAHDDLARVSRFFATDRIVDATGTEHDMHAHEYGPTVLVYAHAEDFFVAEDVAIAKNALRSWLWEKRDEAREIAKSLSPASREKIEKLFHADIASLRTELLADVDRRADAMAAVSPHGHLAGLRAPVYLLHGAGDTVIPATETSWLAHDVPPETLREVLVSPALQHVELKAPGVRDQWSLVHFMSGVIAEAER